MNADHISNRLDEFKRRRQSSGGKILHKLKAGCAASLGLHGIFDGGCNNFEFSHLCKGSDRRTSISQFTLLEAENTQLGANYAFFEVCPPSIPSISLRAASP